MPTRVWATWTSTAIVVAPTAGSQANATTAPRASRATIAATWTRLTAAGESHTRVTSQMMIEWIAGTSLVKSPDSTAASWGSESPDNMPGYQETPHPKRV